MQNPEQAKSLALDSNLPDSGLVMDGVTEDELAFVVAMYAGAFNRAPEYEGLRYWVNQLAVKLGQGNDQKAAYSMISKQMYIDGTINGEAGTDLSNTDYVSFAYSNILGRQGESGGVSYWEKMLNTGVIDRGTFVAVFVGDALGNPGDGEFLQARIAVAKFLAQEHVSGPNAPAVDLGLLAQVSGLESALNAIYTIIMGYGTSQAPKASIVDVASIEISGDMSAALGSADGSGLIF